MLHKAALLAAAVLVAVPGSALAWGNMGHRILGEAAMSGLPAGMPAFLTAPQAIRDVGELSREQDRSRGAGKIHDSNRDPGHFVDLDDEGKLLGGPAFLPLPATRADYEKGLQAAGIDSWKAGYLQYSIIDMHQQLVKDFGYWRTIKAALPREKNKARRLWLQSDLTRREKQILVSIGHLSHFVGDGAQPLHASVHYNGWGDYPNPKGYTTAKIHGPFESEFVFANVNPAMVRGGMAPLKDCNCPIEKRAPEYLLNTFKYVIPLYELEKAGGLAPGAEQGKAFATERLAAGASELRDLIADAWEMSARTSVGWPVVKVEDVVSGKADPYDNLYGKD